MQCWISDTADIALGVAAHATNNETGESLLHWSWPLSWKPLMVGQSASTYAFPNHSIKESSGGQTFCFRPDLYRGSVIEIGEFRDRVLVPYPYMYVDFRIHGAASGGPVVSGEAVVGINCRYMEPDGPGVIGQICNLHEAFLDDVILWGESTSRRVSFPELVKAGAIKVSGYEGNLASRQKGELVRLDEILPSAQAPAITTIIFT
jgi:hypothetical protein